MRADSVDVTIDGADIHLIAYGEDDSETDIILTGELAQHLSGLLVSGARITDGYVRALSDRARREVVRKATTPITLR